MKFFIRTAACTVILFFLNSVALFASSNQLYFKVRNSDNRLQSFRYQQEPDANGSWKTLDGSIPILLLQDFDPAQDKLFIQQS
ncbi:hypothetical protein [Sphaerochaeta globosa]|uniref:Uncharacterized protein n=1 Tax=Sphaerochaeta globosa (strain ATCC BAA-1886 / DSM 22777 / Buddy) TaxID=158189 RepID=F0RZA6_SPHGB|nr:hypothetical protein [Sphaerochaeta globosa]ADY13387.1 hypothetical protein SpiBuddy_1562 [Sphaerochaeta globosa str. Buddy]